MNKINYTAKKNAILNSPTPIAATPESAIISKEFLLGIPLRHIKGGGLNIIQQLSNRMFTKFFSANFFIEMPVSATDNLLRLRFHCTAARAAGVIQREIEIIYVNTN